MEVDRKPEIEIIKWVKFNKPGTKEEMLDIMKNSNIKVSFANKLKDRFNMSMTDALFVANQFYKQD